MKNYLKKFSYILLLTISLFLFSACNNNSKIYTLNLSNAFNTINKVDLITKKTSEDKLLILWEELNQILVDLDNLFNVQERTEETDLMRINNNAGIGPVEVDQEVIDVLKKTIEMCAFSIVDGRALFDPTIAPVWDKWDFINKEYNEWKNNLETIPTNEEIEELIDLVDYTKVEIDDENNTVFLKEEGMKLDLGAIVKGYAADKLKAHLILRGYNKAVIDVGRNILLLGSFVDNKGKDRPFSIGLQTPFVFSGDSEIGTFGDVHVENITIVTSGTYEKYIYTEEGNRYHHILDPRTGFPFNNNVVSVVAICKESIIGDAFSTILFALGIDEGMKVVNELDYLEAIWVIQNGNKKEVYISEGLIDIFVFNSSVESINYVYKGVYNANS